MATILTILWWDQITGNLVTINLLNITGIDNTSVFWGGLRTVVNFNPVYVLSNGVMMGGGC